MVSDDAQAVRRGKHFNTTLVYNAQAREVLRVARRGIEGVQGVPGLGAGCRVQASTQVHRAVMRHSCEVTSTTPVSLLHSYGPGAP